MQDIIEYIEEQFEIGNFGRVERSCDKLITSSEIEIRKKGFLFKGLALYQQSKFKEALIIFSKMNEKFPTVAEGYSAKFDTLINLEQFEEAKKCAEEIVALEDTNPDYLNYRITIDQYLGDYNAVIETCDKILTLHPNAFSFYSIRGSAKISLNQIEEAILDYSKAISFEEENTIEQAYNYNDIGYAYSKLENFTEAQRYLEMSLEITPVFPYALNNLGFVMACTGNISNGIQLINQSIKIDPTNSYAYKNRAKIYLMEGKTKLAQKELLKAQKLDYKLIHDDEVNELLAQIEGTQE